MGHPNSAGFMRPQIKRREINCAQATVLLCIGTDRGLVVEHLEGQCAAASNRQSVDMNLGPHSRYALHIVRADKLDNASRQKAVTLPAYRSNLYDLLLPSAATKLFATYDFCSIKVVWRLSLHMSK